MTDRSNRDASRLEDNPNSNIDLPAFSRQQSLINKTVIAETQGLDVFESPIRKSRSPAKRGSKRSPSPRSKRLNQTVPIDGTDTSPERLNGPKPGARSEKGTVGKRELHNLLLQNEKLKALVEKHKDEHNVINLRGDRSVKKSDYRSDKSLTQVPQAAAQSNQDNIAVLFKLFLGGVVCVMLWAFWQDIAAMKQQEVAPSSNPWVYKMLPHFECGNADFRQLGSEDAKQITAAQLMDYLGNGEMLDDKVKLDIGLAFLEMFDENDRFGLSKCFVNNLDSEYWHWNDVVFRVKETEMSQEEDSFSDMDNNNGEAAQGQESARQAEDM